MAQHSPIKICLTLTTKEYEYFLKKAQKKKITFWSYIQWEIQNFMAKIELDEEAPCITANKRESYTLTLPKRLENKLMKTACHMDMPTAQFVAQVLRANHMFEIISANMPTLPPPVVLPK